MLKKIYNKLDAVFAVVDKNAGMSDALSHLFDDVAGTKIKGKQDIPAKLDAWFLSCLSGKNRCQARILQADYFLCMFHIKVFRRTEARS